MQEFWAAVRPSARSGPHSKSKCASVPLRDRRHCTGARSGYHSHQRFSRMHNDVVRMCLRTGWPRLALGRGLLRQVPTQQKLQKQA